LEIGHQASGSTHENGRTKIFFKRNNWPIANACENSSIEAPTPNKFLLNLHLKYQLLNI
jgi:hypothetical protein